LKNAKRMATAKLRGQRISRPELIAESRVVLAKAGVGNRSRANVLCEVTSEVVHSTNPVLTSLQPRVLTRDTDAWQRAFGLAFQYLEEHQMSRTLQTCATEKGDTTKLERQLSTADEQFSSLLPSRLSAKVLPPIDLPDIPVKQGSPSPRLIDFDAINIPGKSPPKPDVEPKKKSSAPQKRPTGTAATPKKSQKPKLVIESPRDFDGFPTDSDQQSDCVIEEVSPSRRPK
jgi:hypothetical protein